MNSLVSINCNAAVCVFPLLFIRSAAACNRFGNKIGSCITCGTSNGAIINASRLFAVTPLLIIVQIKSVTFAISAPNGLPDSM